MARKPRFLAVSLARGLRLPEMMVSGESAPRARKAGEVCCDLGEQVRTDRGAPVLFIYKLVIKWKSRFVG